MRRLFKVFKRFVKHCSCHVQDKCPWGVQDIPYTVQRVLSETRLRGFKKDHEKFLPSRSLETKKRKICFHHLFPGRPRWIPPRFSVCPFTPVSSYSHDFKGLPKRSSLTFTLNMATTMLIRTFEKPSTIYVVHTCSVTKNS